MKPGLLFFFLGWMFCATAQKVLTEDELISVIVQFHPVARQAAIDVKIAKADVLTAKAGFDPIISRTSGRKEFGGITYYDLQNNDITIPTWYGIDVFAGTEQMTGNRLNPEETSGNITYMGFSIQPIQNLLMDKRRAILLQSRNMYQLSEIQRRIILNDLLQEALKDYWNWWERYHVQQILERGLVNAETRLGFVRKAFDLGDRAAIDTLEAYTQVQSFRLRLLEADQEFIQAGLQLSTYLWTQQVVPTELPQDVIPQPFQQATTFTLETILTTADSHVEFQQYGFLLKGLRIDKKLAFQSLLPELKIKYNQTGYDLSKTLNTSWFNNNYRFAVSMSVPLRLSEGRGKYQKARLKLEQTKIEAINKQLQVVTKVKQYYTEWNQTLMQLTQQNSLLQNLHALQKGEEIRLANGESSLFLVNAREQKVIEAEQKLVELKSKSQRSAIGVRWAAGLLIN